MALTAAFATLGCKVNQYETQRILESFEERGFAIAPFSRPADVYVINTCSVTQAAERKSRQMVRKLARQNPNAVVVMTGCYGEMARITGESVVEAGLVVPNHAKLETLDYLLRAFPDFDGRLREAPRPATRTYVRRTRATIKVQDGCNVYCAFCSIPYTRNVMYSRPAGEIVAEAARLAERGFREIVVTGVLVGSYADPSGGAPDLASLLARLAGIRGIERVRLSSIEPTQVTDDLLRTFANVPKLCPHLHIPLQSGSSAILRAMNRPYDQAFYLRRCERAHDLIPDVAITSDIMVGFPGEDAFEFRQTLDVTRKVGFARAHLFRYSPRPNTPAATFPSQVPDVEKEARSKELAAVCRDMQQAFIGRYIGRTLDVLVEGTDTRDRSPGEGVTGNDEHERIDSACRTGADGLLTGYTGNYLRVQFTGGSNLIGNVARVTLREPTGDGAIGDVA